MHLQNAYYGHARALARWAGVQDQLPIWGYLQHGFNTGTGFTPRDPPRPVPALVWNRRNLLAARERRLNATAIGAPFVYLAAADRSPTTSPQRGTMAYPFHAWELHEATGGHARYAHDLAEREGTASTTVCLYWLEYQDPDVREVYARAGFRVISHGHRTDETFLDRLVAEVADHQRVVSNDLGTAMWYAGYLGKEIEIHGEPMALSGLDPEAVREERRQRWPAMFEGAVAGAVARQLAEEELGHAYRREPEELRRILGWTGTRRLLGRPVATVTRAIQVARKRRQGW
ncbi:hypothetical protein [Nitriliruptor alkaliphilus]|uniref:hypothetical protein n=1 Tax=Nitriliruptor alkaliphilus TaxID=427918 RepID=UPI000696B579|nr:hypothetical protein [Nitriliruptor alkaliphilus]